MSHSAPLIPPAPGSTPCRMLLAAIHDTLNLPYPAAADDELPYYVLRSKRCGLAMEAIDRILRDREADDRDMIAAADILRRQLADFPPDGYRHNPMSS